MLRAGDPVQIDEATGSPIKKLSSVTAMDKPMNHSITAARGEKRNLTKISNRQKNIKFLRANKHQRMETRTMIRLSRITPVVLAGVLVIGFAPVSGEAQGPAGTSAQTPQAPAVPPPATKMEGFKPAAGSVLVFGYDELGSVGGISVDVREMRDAQGRGVRGLVVEVTESQYRKERSFVDADEIPELLKGFDALLEVKANPTSFKNFEVRYTTKGELQLTAFNSSNGPVMYAVQTGRTLKAQRLGLGASDMQKLRGLFEAAAQKLATLK